MDGFPQKLKNIFTFLQKTPDWFLKISNGGLYMADKKVGFSWEDQKRVFGLIPAQGPISIMFDPETRLLRIDGLPLVAIFLLANKVLPAQFLVSLDMETGALILEGINQLDPQQLSDAIDQLIEDSKVNPDERPN